MKNSDYSWDNEEVATPEHDRMILDLLDPETCRKKLHFTKEAKFLKIETEIPVESSTYNSKVIIGFIDIRIEVECGEKWEKLAIEVKPEIRSVGSLIRQINKYKSFTYQQNITHWCVYTKQCTPEIKKAIESQKIIVLIEDQSSR